MLRPFGWALCGRTALCRAAPRAPPPCRLLSASTTTTSSSSSAAAAVAAHYGNTQLARVRAALAEHLPRPPTADDLAAIDEFHLGGRPATYDLLDGLNLEPHQRVADLGSGLGGPARAAAARFGVTVCGFDITPEYVALASELSAMVKMSDKTEFVVADVTSLRREDYPRPSPSPASLAPEDADAPFDAAYTIHVSANIADKAAFYRSVRELLPRGGMFGIYDVVRGDNTAEPVVFPLPFDADGSVSSLLPPREMHRLLAEAGFRVLGSESVRFSCIEFLKDRRRETKAFGPPPLGLHVLLGPDTGTMMGNILANLESERLDAVRIFAQAI